MRLGEAVLGAKSRRFKETIRGRGRRLGEAVQSARRGSASLLVVEVQFNESK
jgi:hypothetical protein